MKTLAVVLFVLVCSSSYGQFSVESIETDEDVKTFLSTFGKKNGYSWDEITVGDYKADNDGTSKRVKNLDSLSNRKWIVEDFNNDGRKDLIYNSIINDQRHFFSLLSNVDSSYDYFNLHKWYHNYYPYAITILKKDTSTLLIIDETKYIQKDTGWRKIRIIDTLKAVLGGFIEIPKKVNSQIKFDTLEFDLVRFPYLTHVALPESMSILITKDHQIRYEEWGSVYNSLNIDDDWSEAISVKHSMHILEKDKSELYQLLSLADFKSMKDSFTISSSHMDAAYVRIKNGKKEKRIIDEGLEGSYWLRLFYTKMFALSKRLRTDMARYFQQHNFDDWQ